MKRPYAPRRTVDATGLSVALTYRQLLAHSDACWNARLWTDLFHSNLTQALNLG